MSFWDPSPRPQTRRFRKDPELVHRLRQRIQVVSRENLVELMEEGNAFLDKMFAEVAKRPYRLTNKNFFHYVLTVSQRNDCMGTG